MNKEQHKLISTFLYEKYKKVSSLKIALTLVVSNHRKCVLAQASRYQSSITTRRFSAVQNISFSWKPFSNGRWNVKKKNAAAQKRNTLTSPQKGKNEGGNSYINYTMCNDYENMPWNQFAEKWGVDGYEKGWVNYRLEHEGWLFSPDSQIAYQYVNPEKYFQMPYFIHRGHFNESSSETLKHWLLQTMSLYKLLNARCDLNRILFRVLQKIELQNIDPEHLLTARDLVSVMEEVDSYTEEEIEERYKSAWTI